MRKGTAASLGVGIAVLVAARMALPSWIMDQMNQELGTFSQDYAVHVGDLDLSLWRMAHSGQDVTARLKRVGSRGFEFLSIENVDVSLAWRELLRGRFVADVDAVRANLKLTTDSIRAVSGYSAKQVKSDAKRVKDVTIPFDLERLRLRDSSVAFGDVPGLPPKETLRLTRVDGTASNLTPPDAKEVTPFTARGELQEDSKIKIVGEARLKGKPLSWNVATEMRKFDLKKVNPIARRMVPFTFESGELSVYAAARSKDGGLGGYFKPFLKDMVLIGDNADFKGPGHFIFEILGTVANWLLTNSKTDMVATRVDFHMPKGGKLEFDTGEAVSRAIDNGFGKALKQSLDVSEEDSASIEVKQVAAQLGSAYVTEVSFPRKESTLAASELRKIQEVIEEAEKNARLKKVTILTWGDRETPMFLRSSLPPSVSALAAYRGESLQRYFQSTDPGVTTRVVNMATRPSKIKQLLRTEDYRIQESLELAGSSQEPKASKAVLIFSVERK